MVMIKKFNHEQIKKNCCADKNKKNFTVQKINSNNNYYKTGTHAFLAFLLIFLRSSNSFFFISEEEGLRSARAAVSDLTTVKTLPR